MTITKFNSFGSKLFGICAVIWIHPFATLLYAEEPQLPGVSTVVDVPSAPTRVSSCAVHFPLDSVRFDESSIAHCFGDVKPEHISYIHVIATASTDGSSIHNLYLSTRRAGAIEGYLRNRYPEIEIHAFGGGANPKFGKMARIFVVESAQSAADPAGPTPVVDTTPVVSKIQTEIKYVYPKKIGVDVVGGTGLAMFNANSSPYQSFAFSGGYNLVNRWVTNLQLGMRYTIHRSNQNMDVHTQHLYADKQWSGRSLRGIKTEYGARVFSGLAVTRDFALDNGASVYFGARAFDLVSSVELGFTRHFRWIGISLGSYI